MTISENLIRQTLADLLKEPTEGASPPQITGITIKDRMVQVSLDIGLPSRAKTFAPLVKKAEAKLMALSGVLAANVILTAEAKAGQSTPSQVHSQPSNHHHDHDHDHHHHHHHHHSTPAPQQRQQEAMAAGAAGEAGVGRIAKIIAVASGKGGVGKSTTAINLACALSRIGRRVGLLDADIYGPSLPRMLGTRESPKSGGGQTVLPLEAYGLKAMSMGFLVPEDEPVVWRGPMVMGALNQMLKDVLWGELDILVVDMPPGTGDAQLTMAQQVKLAGAVIVSTPQDIALLDARKGLNMFRKTNVPVLGIIENMAMFVCPNCGHHSPIFGHGGARAEAARMQVDFLGEIPLEISIRQAADAGYPLVISDPEGIHASHYYDIARKIEQSLFGNTTQANAPPHRPQIIIEE